MYITFCNVKKPVFFGIVYIYIYIYIYIYMFHFILIINSNCFPHSFSQRSFKTEKDCVLWELRKCIFV
jgi:hypothetical protein